ncbi:MAG TPA: class I SAM-dependent DNA methyltransferase [Candidatus Methylomirabilis sp.]|nr:class I SAM-dependent DNA methyltransferase [Candidatus Methylomirabilis sp.]
MAGRRREDASVPLTAKAQLSAATKRARDIMRKDAGLNGDLDRIPQLSWIMFLKCFDDLEQRREVTEKKYRLAIEPPYRWRDWAGDPDKGLTGESLLKFVNDELFPYLRNLTGTGTGDARDILAAVFKETYSRMLSGYLLRDVVNLVNRLNFNSSDDVHTLAHLYESMLREMRDAAGDSGEFYTPRPVIRFIVQQAHPRLGEKVLDPAAGTGGFLVEAYEYLKPQVKSVEDRRRLQEETLFGIEKKPMPYLLGMMNLLLHGLDRPNLLRDNALRNPLVQITDKARYDVIMTNPPFGGEEEKGIQDNFPEGTRTSETALLFLQFIMRSLKRGGRCGMVVPNGTLFGDGVCARVKKELLENFNLHTIVRLPNGVFAPYTSIPTNLLFFDRAGPTKEIWYYEHPLPEGRKNYTKTQPLQFEEFAPCMAWWKNREENDRAWKVSVDDVLKHDESGNLVSANLDIKNPRGKQDFEHLPPEQLADDILKKEQRITEIMAEIKQTLARAG